eukprot:Gb_30945 [translate_table: standard]
MGKSSLMFQTEIILLKTAAQLAFPNLLEVHEKFPRGKVKSLSNFLENYEPKYRAVYKSLALVGCSNMIERNVEKSDSNNESSVKAAVPAILTVRYNAWEYRNESEAWAGLVVKITKEMEETMALAQWSLATTVVVMVWTVVKSTMAILKPISTQIAGYISLLDHIEKLVITNRWDWSPNNVGDTTFPKMRPQFKGNLPIVVLVDDLDRCQESAILQVLTAINLVLAACKIDVILGMEKKIIDRAIIKKYGDQRNNKSKKSNEELADKFFQKIIQLPLDLPDPSDAKSKRYIFGRATRFIGW